MSPPVGLTPSNAVWAGEGAAGCALAGLPAGDVAVLWDPAVESFVAAVAAAHPQHRFQSRSLHGTATFEAVRATSEWLVTLGGAPVLAIGGGTVLDVAKLAVLDAGSPILVQVRRRVQRAGYATLTGDVTRTRRLIALPTTIGTGAEVSAVACIADENGHRTLVHSPLLRPDVAILDPGATRTLPQRLVREGALEALLRVAGSEIAAPSSLPVAGIEARHLTRRLGLALDACRAGADDDLRLLLAQLSGATHRGWALTGRGPYPSPLWFLANELSAVLGTSKMTATAILLPAWLELVADGDERWGDRERLADVWAAMTGTALPVDVGGAARALLEHWRVTPASTCSEPAVAQETARRAVRRWGGRLPMLGRFAEHEIAALTGDALAPFNERTAA